jgi:beta-lactam-binding protein with PASTA domain
MEKEKSSSSEPKFRYLNTFGKIGLIFFTGFSLFILVSTIMIIILTKPKNEVRVPDVVGKRFNDAYNSLVSKGLRPEIKFHDVSDIQSGLILNQYPEAGDVVPEDNTLKLTVSRSGYSLDVPNLVGKNLMVAQNSLKNLHYHGKTFSIITGVVSYIPSDKTAENIVIGQSPKAGEKITPDQKMNLLVSSGARKDAGVTMPDVKGQSIDLCYDLLAAKGLMIRQEIVETMDKTLTGTVLEQNPAANSPIAPGSEVILRVALYQMKEHPYHAYERIIYTIPSDQKEGLYEALVEDDMFRRICFSRKMKGGEQITFVFQRNGKARISILREKEVIGRIGVSVED